MVYDHMIKKPEDYAPLVSAIDSLPKKPDAPATPDPTVEYIDYDKVYFTVEVDVPYVMGETFNADGTVNTVNTALAKVYIDFRAYETTKAEIDAGRDYQTLIATATTDYGLTNNVVEAEVIYVSTSGNYTFQRGNFLN